MLPKAIHVVNFFVSFLYLLSSGSCFASVSATVSDLLISSSGSAWRLNYNFRVMQSMASVSNFLYLTPIILWFLVPNQDIFKLLWISTKVHIISENINSVDWNFTDIPKMLFKTLLKIFTLWFQISVWKLKNYFYFPAGKIWNVN